MTFFVEAAVPEENCSTVPAKTLRGPVAAPRLLSDRMEKFGTGFGALILRGGEGAHWPPTEAATTVRFCDARGRH